MSFVDAPLEAAFGFVVRAVSLRNPYIKRRDFPLLPVFRDNSVGRNFWEKMHNHNFLLPCDHPLVVKTDQIFQESIEDVKSTGRKDLLKMNWKVAVGRIDKHCCRGPTIVMSEELIKHANDHVIAANLCHEIGHVISRHDTGFALGLKAILNNSQPGHSATLNTDFMNYMRVMKLQTKADEISAVLTARIGYDPRAYLDTFVNFVEGFETKFGMRVDDERVKSAVKISTKASLFYNPLMTADTLDVYLARVIALLRSDGMERAIEIYKLKQSNNEAKSPYECTGEVWPELTLPYGHVVIREDPWASIGDNQ